MENIGKIILRVGLSIVFFWFAFNQLMNPDMWTSFIPSFITNLGLTARTFVLLNGTAELALASLLILGLYTRIVSLLLSLHLYGIAISVGLNPVGVRDFGLACAALSLFFSKPDSLALDSRLQKNNKDSEEN